MMSILDEPLRKPMREAFAAARARGLSPVQAAAAAGYAHPAKRASGLAKNPELRARAEAMLERRRGGHGDDLSGVIEDLIAAARKGIDESAADARGLMAARACLAEAARLKMGLGLTGPGAAEAEPTEPPLDMAAYEARYILPNLKR